MDQDFIKKFETMFNKINQIEATVSGMNDKITVALAKIDKIEEENNKIKDQVIELKKENLELNTKINEMDQYSRKRNVIISGIPYREHEELREIIKTLTMKLNIRIDNADINAAHRLPGKKNIILCLNNLDKKEELIKWSKTNKKRNIRPEIYINEHLTSYNIQLLKEANSFKNEIRFAWSRNGQIFIRVKEDSPAVKIRNF